MAQRAIRRGRSGGGGCGGAVEMVVVVVLMRGVKKRLSLKTGFETVMIII